MRAFFTGLAFAAAACACAAAGSKDALRDARGREVAVPDASRIVSVGGAITEILYALNQERRIVGVDSTSLYPPQALREKPNVGYMRQLSPEGLLGLRPSVIVASEGSGPKEAMAVLEAAAVPLVMVPDHFSGEGIIEKIRIVAAAAGVAERGECLAKAVQADLDGLARLRARIGRPLKGLFLLSFVSDKAQVAGRATAADGILKLAGTVNAIADYDGYKPINDEAVIAASPDFVLTMNRGGHALDAATVFAHPAFALTPAAKRSAFLTMEGLYLLGFGPRTALAARDLAAEVYPALAAGKLPSEAGAKLAEICRE
jgi:iron complex transport system substrate-binding protein